MKIIADPEDLLGLLTEVFDRTREFDPGPRVKSEKTKTTRFLKEHPEFSEVPKSFVRGCFLYDEPKTDGGAGIAFRGSYVSVGNLGEIKVGRCVRRSKDVQWVHFSPFNGGELRVRARIFLSRRADFTYENRQDSNLFDLKKKDPVVYFLTVNQIPPGREFWKKYAILNYVKDNPDVTRRDVEKMGLRSDWDWDLLVDFQNGMQEWLRAVSKPPECNILSKGQINQRQKKELRLPDVINDHDVSQGNLKNQSYDKQIFDAMNRQRYEFLT